VLILIVNKTITSLPCQRSVRGNRQADRPVCYGVVVTNGSIYPPFIARNCNYSRNGLHREVTIIDYITTTVNTLNTVNTGNSTQTAVYSNSTQSANYTQH